MFKTYCKALIPANDNSLLHFWQQPLHSVYSIETVTYHDHYFVMPKNNVAFTWSVSISQHSLNVMHLINYNIFSKQELETYFAFNIFDMCLLQVCEGRITTSFYFNDHNIMNNLIWDIYIDDINHNVFVSKCLLKKFMGSVSTNRTKSFYITNSIPLQYIKIEQASPPC